MIQAYFRDELDDSQQTLVTEHFRQHPEDLHRYITEKGWEDFTPAEDLPLPISDKMLQVIGSATYDKSRVRKMIYRWTSVAAVFLLTVGGYFMLTNKHVPGNPQPGAVPAGITEARPDWRSQMNSTGKTMQVSMADGSRIEISNGSSIRYIHNFTTEKREIWLTGTALFTVAKDKKRSFTVHAGDLDVTALGTVFKVTAAADGQGPTAVRLLSGKVVVNPDSGLLKKGILPVYLEPGQMVSLDRQMNSMTLSRPANKKNTRSRTPALQQPSILTFNNEPLATIFNTLSTTFQVRLDYREEILKGMRFTGKFDSRNETLDSFLGIMATLNNLIIRQEKNTYYISQ